MTITSPSTSIDPTCASWLANSGLRALSLCGRTLLPIVQGGMGIGVSAHRLAGSVAALGGVGTLSSVDLRRHHPDLMERTRGLGTGEPAKKSIDAANLVALDREIQGAKDIAQGRGLVAVNVMKALSAYEQYVRQALESGADAVVVGDQKPYLVAIVMIDQENVEKYAQDNDVPFSNYASLTKAPEVQALIQTEIDRVNKKFARVEQIKKFFLLDTQLSAEDEELTPTMKLKRKLVEKKYAPQIEAMYR